MVNRGIRSNIRRRLGALGLLTVAIAACAVDATPSDDGATLYSRQCIACHGAERQGVDGLGVTLVGSELVMSSDADELVAFLKVGRMPNDPASLTGGVMPGFSWMPEADLRQIVEYLAGN